ncbi:MAG TPA: Ku protein [Acidimicrobiales bacterium]|nr:Ku protein [Acidimicrobiales bacterium]
MPPRAIWSGSISFGLVNVPVKLATAVSSKDVRFNQLHAPDNARIQQKRWCPEEDKEIPFDEIVKGYEVSPGQYVVIDPDELAALDPKATHTIDIEEFVDLDEIDPIYFEHPYYVVPEPRAGKAYALLVEAMTRTNKVALARLVLRTKQYLAALRPKDGALVLNTLLYADEVRPIEGIEEVDATQVSDKELKMAEQLVESLSAKFDPEKYHDEYRQQVIDMIEAKAAGQEIVSQPAVTEAPTVVDLMAALEASLAASKKGAGGEDGRRPGEQKSTA